MILAYDIGTSFLKGAVIDANGKVLSRAQAPVRAACAEERGRHECDANTWLSGIALVTAQLSLRERSRLRGVVVSSNGPTLVPVSAEGEALDFAMTWMDRRAAEEAELISDFSESQLDASFYLPKVLWIMRHKPEMYQKTRWFLPCAEFVSFYLTGNPFRVIPTAHSREFFWNESAVPRVGVDPGKLPPFIEPGEPAGSVSLEAEEILGIPAGLPVFAGGPDYVMSILGTASVQQGRACDRAGTSEGVNLCWQAPVRDPRLLCYPHVAPGAYNVSALLSSSGSALRWAAESFGRRKGEVDSLFAEIRDVPAGSRRLLFLPFLSPERFGLWDPAVRGGFLGLTLDHGRQEMMKAVVESSGYAVRAIIELMESHGCRIGDLRVTGGQARVPLWCQIRADITGKRVLLPEEEDSELVGNACAAAYGLGDYDSLAEAAERMVRFQKTFIPSVEKRQVYDEIYRVFTSAAAGLGELFQGLAGR